MPEQSTGTQSLEMYRVYEPLVPGRVTKLMWLSRLISNNLLLFPLPPRLRAPLTRFRPSPFLISLCLFNCELLLAPSPPRSLRPPSTWAARQHLSALTGPCLEAGTFAWWTKNPRSRRPPNHGWAPIFQGVSGRDQRRASNAAVTHHTVPASLAMGDSESLPDLLQTLEDACNSIDVILPHRSPH